MSRPVFSFTKIPFSSVNEQIANESFAISIEQNPYAASLKKKSRSWTEKWKILFYR